MADENEVRIPPEILWDFAVTNSILAAEREYLEELSRKAFYEVTAKQFEIDQAALERACRGSSGPAESIVIAKRLTRHVGA